MVADAGVPLTPRSKNEIVKTSQWGCDFQNSNAPVELIVRGREGYNETMNGRYVKGEAEHEGRVYYKHETRKFVIRFCPAKKSWFFDWRGLKTDTIASAALAEDVESPILGTQPWRVFDGEKWISDTKLVIECSTESFQKEKVKAVFTEEKVGGGSAI